MIKTIWQHSTLRYALVGAINTLVSWCVMFGLMFIGVMPEIANFAGWVVGFLNSYILNKKFTFQSKNSHTKDMVRFGVAMGIAYGVNLLTLIIGHRMLGINEYIAQIIAAVSYTITGYIVSKFWAFKQDPK